MARQRDYKAEYARAKERAAARGTTPYQERIQRGLAQGKTRQEARGHKPGEWQRRKEYAKQLGYESLKQRQAMRKIWGERAAYYERNMREAFEIISKAGPHEKGKIKLPVHLARILREALGYDAFELIMERWYK